MSKSAKMQNADLAGVSDGVLGSKAAAGINSFVSGLAKGENISDYDLKPEKQAAVLKLGGGTGLGSASKHGKAPVSAKKPMPLSKYNPDQTDRIYDLERENMNLKQQGNLLGDEIVMMKTKLKRIEEMLRKKGKNAPESAVRMPEEVERLLADEISVIQKENGVIKDRTLKLREIEREFASQRQKKPTVKKAPTNKFAHVRGKLGDTSLKQSEQDFLKLVEALKVRLVQGERQIIQLTTQRDKAQGQLPSHGASDIQIEIDSMQKELSDTYRRIAEMRSNIIQDETMFNESRAFVERKQDEIQTLNREIEGLRIKNSQINLRAQTAKGLSEDLNELRIERDQIQKSIENVIQYPFERNQTGEPSVVQRTAQLHQRLEGKQNQLVKLKDEEQRKWDEVSQLKAKVQELKGQNDYVKGQHQEAKQKFVSANGEATVGDVYRDLYQMDRQKHQETVADTHVKPDSMPIWKDYDFLERSNAEQPLDLNDPKSLGSEVRKMKHENKDLAAELDKAQQLLKLQSDIEKENRVYNEAEKQRLKLLAQSTQLKTHEMQKRVDGLDTHIKVLKQKLGEDQSGSRPGSPEAGLGGRPGSAHGAGTGDYDHDFAVDPLDEQCGPDENYLDLKIVDGMFFEDLVQRFLGNVKQGGQYKDLMTLVSVDFLDHASKATHYGMGYRPNYNTQISFRNRVDDFYINYLSKDKMRLEVWVAESGSKGIMLGSAEILLSELVYTNRIVADSIAQKTAVFDKMVNIQPAPAMQAAMRGSTSQFIGQVNLKMRMRKPINEAMRFNRELGEVRDAARVAKMKEEHADYSINQQKVINVTIEGCEDLRAPVSDLSKIAPFFSYTFYTFDARNSHTGRGPNPSFRDTNPYSVTFNDGLMNYLETSSLEIYLVDDDAPVSGIERGGQSNQAPQTQCEDLIGVARVPLQALAKGSGSINGKFDVKGQQGEKNGQIIVKISVVDASTGTRQNLKKSANDVKQIEQQSFTASWEEDVIMRIARKLGRLSIDVHLMFGIFSRGGRICTREDFKYCCLQRLDLKSEISEREVDMLLEAKLGQRPNVEQREFVQIFQRAIAAAREEALRQDAQDQSMVQRYNDMMRTKGDGTFKGQSLNRSESTGTLMDFQRKGAATVLIGCILRSSFDVITRTVRKSASGDRISANALRQILSSEGGASNSDATKVTNLLAVDGNVFCQKFTELLSEARLEARFNSKAIQKFHHVIQAQCKPLCEAFMARDIDKDGQLSLEGFKAALLHAVRDLSDYRLDIQELPEIFNLISTDGAFLYAEYVKEVEPQARDYFPKLNLPTDDSRLAESSVTVDLHRSSTEQDLKGRGKAPLSKTIGARAASGRQKVEQFLIANDITLSVLFNVIDTDSDNSLVQSEFKQKLRGLHLGLVDEELEALYTELDRNRDGRIVYAEFIEQFAKINAAQLIKRMRKVLYGAQVPIEQVYNKHCSGLSMYEPEFKSLISSLIGTKVAEFEVKSIFRELDRNNTGVIPKDRFLDWFGHEEQEKLFQTGIEDIIKPLKTLMERKRKAAQRQQAKGGASQNADHATLAGQVRALFRKYDRDGDALMTADELKGALRDLLDYDMTQEEVKTMREFFRARFKARDGLKQAEFLKLIEQEHAMLFDGKAARAAVADVNKALKRQARDIRSLLVAQALPQAAGEEAKEVTVRGFKLAIYGLNCLTQQGVNNLSKWLDRNNNGFIEMSDVEAALSSPDTFKPHQRSSMEASATKSYGQSQKSASGNYR